MADRKPRECRRTYGGRRRHESATSSRRMRSQCECVRKAAGAAGMPPAASAGLPSGVMIPVCSAKH